MEKIQLEADMLLTFVYKKEGKTVGVKSWFYECEADAVLKAEEYMDMYNADVVEIHRYEDNAGVFTRYTCLTGKRNDIKWRDTFISHNVFPTSFYKCQELAKGVGYKYLLFNGRVYSVTGSIDEELCEEKDLIV